MLLKNSTVLEASIPSKNLGIVNTAKGLKTPKWFYDIVENNASTQIVIKDIDSISKASQEKFAELVKYKTISGVQLPSSTTIIATASDISKVNENILRLFVVIEG